MGVVERSQQGLWVLKSVGWRLWLADMGWWESLSHLAHVFGSSTGGEEQHAVLADRQAGWLARGQASAGGAKLLLQLRCSCRCMHHLGVDVIGSLGLLLY